MGFAQQLAGAAAIAQSQNNDLAVQVVGFVRVFGDQFEQWYGLQVEGRRSLDVGFLRGDLHGPFLIREFERETV